METSKTVIVIDDEIRICQSFEKVLRRRGFCVEAFTSGQDALVRLEAGGVDLVLSDLMMPEMSGVELLREMHARGIEVPLVMITGYASVENAVESMRFRAVDYLPKPFTVAELMEVVARGLCASKVDVDALPSSPEETYQIRNHSWARMGESGEVVVGVHPFVLACCGTVVSVELPMDEDELVQGGVCGKLLVADSTVPIRLWAPITGDIKAVNERVHEDPSVLAADPYGAGWLLKVKPSNFEKDIEQLIASPLQ